MADETSKVDSNARAVLTGITDDVAAEIRRLLVDPTTGRLKVSAVVTGAGIESINSLTASAQTIAVGSSGDDVNVASATATHTINLPTASATKRGVLSSTDWSTFNGKMTSPMIALGDIIYGGASGTPTRLAGNTTTTKKFLIQVGDGVNSAAPSWGIDLSTDTALGSSDTVVPTQKAIKTYADSLVVGLLDYRGAYDASGNTYPTTGGSGTGGAVLKGDMWIISVVGTLGGEAVQVGDSIIANADTPGQTAGNWNHLNGNISYVPEDSANKVTSISGSSTDTQYPSAKLLYDQLAGKQATLTFGIANTNAVQIDAADVADNDYAKFTASGLEGRSYSEVLSDIGALANVVEDTTPQLGGDLDTNAKNIVLAENSSIDHDPSLSADGKYTGLCITGTAGAALAFGDLIYLDPTDSRWELADANIAAGSDGDPRGILGMCVLAAANDGSATKILLNGVIRADTAFPTLTINAPVYVSETPGDVVVTQPTTSGVVIRILGYGLTADAMYFNPENDFITHT